MPRCHLDENKQNAFAVGEKLHSGIPDSLLLPELSITSYNAIYFSSAVCSKCQGLLNICLSEKS